MEKKLRIHQIKCPLGEKPTSETIAKKIHASPSDILSFQIERESLDARKEEIHYTYTVLAEVKNAQRYIKKKDVSEGITKNYTLPPFCNEETDRPVVVGFGPAGMYAGLILAECGYRPIIIERGKKVEERSKDVTSFFQTGKLNVQSNVQFGEGGAGTFSDGKLTTRIKNIRIQKVLQEFVEAGAEPEITYQHRPHIGTDVLRTVVHNIREKILSLNGEIRFETTLLQIHTENGALKSIHTNKGDIPCTKLILCTGHSASDTYETLFQQGLVMIQKDFATGVRVEHPQALIDRSTYGEHYENPNLPTASYRLSHTASNGRGVYSFCMCPGGVVIPASCEENTLAVNGMSYSTRDGKNANSAILVQIPSSDFDHGSPLDGFQFQKELEKAAFRPSYQAPAQNIIDFVNNKKSTTPVLQSSYPRGIIMENMHSLFSDAVNGALTEGFLAFDKKINGFLSTGIMVGMESRSSSPIRIPRNENGESCSIKGIYPCGEGAGYAGGIVSSAVDGITQAERVITSLQPK